MIATGTIIASGISDHDYYYENSAYYCSGATLLRVRCQSRPGHTTIVARTCGRFHPDLDEMGDVAHRCKLGEGRARDCILSPAQPFECRGFLAGPELRHVDAQIGAAHSRELPMDVARPLPATEQFDSAARIRSTASAAIGTTLKVPQDPRAGSISSPSSSTAPSAVLMPLPNSWCVVTKRVVPSAPMRSLATVAVNKAG
ncbi:hypothetical protein AM571_PA00365 (plasmid) [Rhizobium etli 8C-3]|uniref:Uncharacterized protein n=1 Tax=Rhizobium etli 8C-3 TaxID=538025 RepID=A0A1L5PAU5_RHIET|nr:hypothetical protein AM571_PA00365 [Rhizobium etli 8C-3]